MLKYLDTTPTFPDVFYYYQDKLGSTTHVTNAIGALLESYRYDLYGTPFYYRNNVKYDSSIYGISDLYAGERWASELSLYDLRNRFMSPELGRFLQPDPIGFKGDASNLYRYCGNDPVDKTDPTGLVERSAGSDFWHNLTSFFNGNPSMTVVEDAWNEQRSGGLTMGQMSATERTKPEAGKLPQYSDWRDAADSRREETMNLVQGDRKEYGGELAQKNDNSKNFVATSPHPGPGVKKVDDGIQKGHFQTFSPNPARVPRGYHMTGFYYGHVYHDPRSFHYDAMRAQARGLDAVLFLPARTGAMSRRPTSLYYDHNTEPPE